MWMMSNANYIGLFVGDRKNKNIPTKPFKKNVMDISMGNEYSFLMFAREQQKQELNVSKVGI